jgi:hypothetical protein
MCKRVLQITAILIGVAFCFVGCGHGSDEHRAEAVETARKVRMREIISTIAEEIIQKTNITNVREVILAREYSFLSVPNSMAKFGINTNLALWKATVSNPSDKIALYFIDGRKACGLTYTGQFLALDAATLTATFSSEFTQ